MRADVIPVLIHHLIPETRAQAQDYRELGSICIQICALHTSLVCVFILGTTTSYYL